MKECPSSCAFPTSVLSTWPTAPLWTSGRSRDSIKNLPLIVMELEELLPDCYIHGVDIEKPPNPQSSGIPEDFDLSEAELLEKYGGEVTNIEWEKWWGLE